jgi:hypothetical protein
VSCLVLAIMSDDTEGMIKRHSTAAACTNTQHNTTPTMSTHVNDDLLHSTSSLFRRRETVIRPLTESASTLAALRIERVHGTGKRRLQPTTRVTILIVDYHECTCCNHQAFAVGGYDDEGRIIL